MEENINNKSVLQRLWDRRFFQYLATYLGVSWGLIQFVEWLVSRYNLDSGWVDNLAIFLFAILPTVILFIYFHGRAGHDEWKPFEKIVYPINFVVAIIAAFFLFDTNAQDRVREVEVTNLEGDTITRIMPAKEFTSKIVFFPFTTESGVESWKGYAAGILANVDIEQDFKWYAYDATSMKEAYNDNGYSIEEDIPFSTKLKIAANRFCSYFAEGQLSKNEHGYLLDFTIYNVENGKKELEKSVESNDLYGLVDQMTAEIRSSINNVKLDKVAEVIDLPSSDLITDNEGALEHYVKGIIALEMGPSRYDEAIPEIYKAAEMDENCAECLVMKMVGQQLQGERGEETIKKAVEVGSSLPERQKFRLNYLKYIIDQDIDKMLKLLETWKKLYPNDSYPYNKLIGYYKSSFQNAKVAEVAAEAIENNHLGGMLLEAADVNVKLKNFDKAQEYTERFQQLYPKRAAKSTSLSEILMAQGEYNKALPKLEEIFLLNPEKYNLPVLMAECYYKMNDYKQADEMFDDALDAANTPLDSLDIYEKQMLYLARNGRADEYLKVFNKHKEIYLLNYPAANYVQVLIQYGNIYTKIGATEKQNEILNEGLSTAPEFARPTFEMMIDFVRTVWEMDKDAYLESYAKVKPLLASAGESSKYINESLVNYFNDNYELSLAKMDTFENVTGIPPLDQAKIVADCYLGLNQAKEGIRFLEEAMKTDPYHPTALLHKLRLHIANGDNNEIQKLIPILDKIYADAHPQWEEKLLLEELKANVPS